MSDYGDRMRDAEFLAGAFEVGYVLGIKPNTVNAWRARPKLGFPEPVVQLQHGAIWDIREVIAWAEGSNRVVAHREYRAPRPAPKLSQ